MCCGIAWGQTPRFAGVQVSLWPTPRVVPADGKSASTIRAEFRDATGRPVVDGTTVVFRMEGGQLSLQGDERRQVITTTTVAGGATVYATSSEPGVATVYAELTTGEGKNRTTVAFVEEGSSLLGAVAVAHIRSGSPNTWIGYALDLGLVEARDNAEIEFSGVLIKARDVVQMDVRRLTLKAHNVRIEVGDRSLEADAISYDLMSGQGVLRRMSDTGVERFCFDCYSLEEREPEEEIRGQEFALATADAVAWAVAGGVSVHPHEKVVLRDATLYAGAKKVVDLPNYWIIAMPGYTGTTHSRVLGVTSEGDIAVDFPYFYRVTETRTGAVKLQNGATSGSVMARDDWSLALEEAYDTGGTEGHISLLGLPRDDWGFEWRDRRALGDRRDGHFTAYSPDHESYFADANIYEWWGDRRLNLTASLQRPRGEDISWGASADWLTMNQPLGSWNASYRVGTAVGLRHVAAFDSGVVGEHQVYSAVDFPRTHLGERTSLRPSVSDLFTWDTGGFQRNSLRGELQLRQVVSSDKSIRLSYQGQFTSGDEAEGYEHLLNLDVRAYHGLNLSSFMTGTYDLSDDELYAFGLVDYLIDDRWRLGLAATYYQVESGDYDDYEVTVAREIGGTEIGLRWSEATGRISLEFGETMGLGF
ncbi:MAG: Ig-like domain-containing protein [Armatimonadota bacterium]|nr:Ig-like domain-containing protein [Armatimonadota bacterium]